MKTVRKTRCYLNLGFILVIVQITNSFLFKSSSALIKSQHAACIRSRNVSRLKARDRKFFFQSHSEDRVVAQQNMVFQDTTAQSSYMEPCNYKDPTYSVQDVSDASLADYLARPVLIHTQPWTVGSAFSISIDPWTLFYTNSRVQKKVEGFYLQRFDLKIKVLINGSPFYYGKCMVSYNPLGQSDAIEYNSIGLSDKLISRSQRNCIVLDSTTSAGGVISCPYFYPRSYQELPTAFKKMGSLDFDTFNQLNNSNGATSAIYIQVYAWAENVVLSIPTNTVHLTSHSDEYSTDTHTNKPSNAMMNIAGKIGSTLGTITEYAMATQAVVSAIGEVALVFGFSRPVNLDKQSYIKNLSCGNISNVDSPECVHKLTLDSKQEITIDPRTAGIEPVDELQLSTILKRDSYLTQFQWGAVDSTGDLLWSSRVNPVQYAVNDYDSGLASCVTPTILAYCSQLFEYWTGDMEYTFSVVASTYHKGRLLVVYDPSPPTTNAMPDSNSVYSRIIDISEIKDFTVRIGYSQAQPYQIIRSFKSMLDTCGIGNAGLNYGPGILTGGISNANLGSNGTISVFVLNPLLNPSASDTGTPSVLVRTKACDNFRFAGVSTLGVEANGSVLPISPPLLLESHSLTTVEPVLETETIAMIQDVDPYPLVWFGETFTSLRALLKRYNYFISYNGANSAIWGVTPSVPANISCWVITKTNMPNYIGYDPLGYSKIGLNSYFPGRLTTLTYIMPMYLGWRGGIRHKYRCTGGATGLSAVVRSPNDETLPNYESELNSIGLINNASSVLTTAATVQTSSGGSLASPGISPIIEVEIPYYAPDRFTYCHGIAGYSLNPAAPATALGATQRHLVSNNVPASASVNLTMEDYVSVGEDFQLLWLLSAPPVYIKWAGS